MIWIVVTFFPFVCPISLISLFAQFHCVKSYSVSLRIHSECGKIQTRKSPNTDTTPTSSNPKKLTLLICYS